MPSIKAYAAKSAGAHLEPFEFTPKPLGDEEVDVAVDYCGICHSDLSMIHNNGEWRNFRSCPDMKSRGAWLPRGLKRKTSKSATALASDGLQEVA